MQSGRNNKTNGASSSLLIGVFVLLVSAFVPTAAAQTDGHQHTHGDDFPALTVVAGEGADCPEGTSFCFEIASGNVAAIGPGSSVQVTFRNEGAAVHNLAIGRLADADATHEDTDPSQRIAGSADEVQPGDEETFIFHVPVDAGGLYLWCHVPGHEALGMWLELGFADGGTTPTGDDDHEDDGHAHGAGPTYPLFSTVELGDYDLGIPVSAAEAELCHVDSDSNGAYTPGETLYLNIHEAHHGHEGDEDHEEEETPCEHLLFKSLRLVPPAGFEPASQVLDTDWDRVIAIGEVTYALRFFDTPTGHESGEFDGGEPLYVDLTQFGTSRITAGDLRLTGYDGFAPLTIVQQEDPDVNLPLTELGEDLMVTFDTAEGVYQAGHDSFYLNVDRGAIGVADLMVEENDVRLSTAAPNPYASTHDASGQLDAMEQAHATEMSAMYEQIDAVAEDLLGLRTSLDDQHDEGHESLDRLDALEQQLAAIQAQLDQLANAASTDANHGDGEQQNAEASLPAPAVALVLTVVAFAAVGLKRGRGRDRR